MVIMLICGDTRHFVQRRELPSPIRKQNACIWAACSSDALCVADDEGDKQLFVMCLLLVTIVLVSQDAAILRVSQVDCTRQQMCDCGRRRISPPWQLQRCSFVCAKRQKCLYNGKWAICMLHTHACIEPNLKLILGMRSANPPRLNRRSK